MRDHELQGCGGQRHLMRAAQGFDAGFIRMWEFYLAYCEGGFLERSIGVSHLLLARPGYRPEADAHGEQID